MTYSCKGYPSNSTDYLDASCLLFAGSSFVSVVDYKSKAASGIVHSGDLMDNYKRIGHHIIDVNLAGINLNITSCFFTLAAWNSPTIQYFPNPSLKMFDKTNPDKQLCNYSNFLTTFINVTCD